MTFLAVICYNYIRNNYGSMKMYNVNDEVMYSPYGICIILEIAVRDFSGEPMEYYILRPVGDSKNTFYVPTQNENLTSQMRPVLTREEINELISVMPDDNEIYIDDSNRRRDEYQRILRDGDRHELVRLIKTLYLRRQDRKEQRKKLLSAEEHTLRNAENLLYDEFAYVLGIPREQVITYIREHISA